MIYQQILYGDANLTLSLQGQIVYWAQKVSNSHLNI